MTSLASPSPSLPSLLIVDDDPLIIDTLGYVLEHEFELLSANSRSAAIAMVRQRGGRLDLALMIDLTGCRLLCRIALDEGLALIGELLAHDPHCKIIVLSGQNEEAHARHARTLGAPRIHPANQPSQTCCVAALQRAQQLRKQELDVVSASQALERIVGESPAILATRAQLQRFAGSHFPVLIEGESGAGKEVAAQALA